VPEQVAVVGAAGYGGAVAAAILRGHPSLELSVLTARSDVGRFHDELYPRYRVPLLLESFDADSIAARAQSAIVAYPHGAAASAVKALRERGLKVVDLSADFRLDRELYESWYQAHAAPELLDEAVYGLTEIHRDEIRGAELVAAPGCYPTAALLAIWPLRDHIGDVVIDAKSGVSGAGREATRTTHFVSVSENVQAYQIEGHRHAAELDQELNGPTFTFVPHLVPIEQGLLASCYATVDIGADELRDLYREAYEDEPFIDLVDRPPGTDEVRETNRCRIQVKKVGGRVIALAAIDNLWKGAAGQAVQDLNLMLGLPETEGLE
jgi:N-acetyl-gamma-glutamyl-phosphate reductase